MMFIWVIVACSALLIQASQEQTPSAQNIQQCLSDLFNLYDQNQQSIQSITIRKLAANFKKLIDENSSYKKIKSTDLLLATQNHTNILHHLPKYQKFLETICFLYAQNLYIRKGITIPRTLPQKLHTSVAGALLNILLFKAKQPPLAEILLDEDFFEPGSKTSETGITYILRTKQIYATINQNKIVPKKQWPLDHNLDYFFSGIAVDDLFMYHIKTDTKSNKTNFELYDLKHDTVDSLELPIDANVIDIVYNTQHKTFGIVLVYFEPHKKIQLFFYDPATKQKSFSAQENLPVELLAAAIPPEDPFMRAEIIYANNQVSLTTLRNFFEWDYIDSYIVGKCPIHESIKLITYNKNSKSFSFIQDPNTFIEQNKKYALTLLTVYINTVPINYFKIAPKTFIIDYHAIIQQVLNRYKNEPKADALHFDFSYMRYIKKHRAQKKITVHDIIPHTLYTAIQFMNTKYHELGDKYTNILNDALYAVNALNNTPTYQALKPTDQDISHVSKRLLEILPLQLPLSQTSSLYNKIKQNLGSFFSYPFNYTKSFCKEYPRMCITGMVVGFGMLGNYLLKYTYSKPYNIK